MDDQIKSDAFKTNVISETNLETIQNEPEKQNILNQNEPIKQKRNLIIPVILIGLVLVLGIIFLIIFGRAPQIETPQIPLSPTPSATQVITPTLSLSDGWKTYVNKSFGFEFKYPPKYEIREVNNPDEFVLYIRTLETTQKGGQSIFLLVMDNREEINIVEWFNDEKVRQRGNILFPAEPLKFNQITFNSNVWYSFEKNTDLPEFRPNGKIYWAIQHENKFYLLGGINLSFAEYKDMLYKILTSFTFTNNEELGEAQTQEECLQKGGVWQSWGLLQQEFCQVPSFDSEKTCNDGSQCSLGNCISENGKLPGKCQKYKFTYGCFSLVEKTKISSTICVD